MTEQQQVWPERVWTLGQASDLEARILKRINTSNPETSPAARALVVVCERHGSLILGDVGARQVVCLSCTDGYEEHDPFPCADLRAIADALRVAPDA